MKTCNDRTTITLLTGICERTERILISTLSAPEKENALRDYLHIYTLSKLKVFASFIGCTQTAGGVDHNVMHIVDKLMELFCPTNMVAPTPPPPPPQVTRPRVTPPPPPAASLIPASRIHIHLDVQPGGEMRVDCPVCLDDAAPLHSMTTLQCSHRVCTECFRTIFMNEKNKHVHHCPLCRGEINAVTVSSYEAYYNIANMYLS